MTRAREKAAPKKRRPAANTKAAASAKRGRGRPTAYKPEFVEQAAKLCALGATDIELADFFNVNVRTIYRWSIAHLKFCQSLKAGKEIADERVVRALYQKAVGYSFESEKIFCTNGKVTRVKTIEHVPPSDTAAIFWLKNRRREEWRDHVDVEMSGSVQQLSDEDLNAMLVAMLTDVLAPSALERLKLPPQPAPGTRKGET